LTNFIKKYLPGIKEILDMQEKFFPDLSRVFVFPAIVERDAMKKELDAMIKESDARLKESEEQRIRLAEENQKLRSELELIRKGSLK
jgi:hypothetical protein